MCEVVITRMVSPWYWPDFLFQLSRVGAKQRKALSVIHGLTHRVIAQRREELNANGKHDVNENDAGKIINWPRCTLKSIKDARRQLATST